jgi:hypothetical protein
MRLLKLPDYCRAYIAGLRDPDWQHVLELFRFHSGGVSAVQRLTRVWIDNHELLPVNVFSGRIVEETWSAQRIGSLVDEMAGISHVSGLRNSMRTTESPRFVQFPLVVVRTQGKEFFIDGRRRANAWRHHQGEYAVRVIDVAPRDARSRRRTSCPAPRVQEIGD